MVVTLKQRNQGLYSSIDAATVSREGMDVVLVYRLAYNDDIVAGQLAVF